MKLSDLTALTSMWIGLPPATVAMHARSLRELRQLSTGQRGSNAAEMTLDDMITLLISTCGCSTASDAGNQIQFWNAMTLSEVVNHGNFAFDFLSKESFTDALLTLVEHDLRDAQSDVPSRGDGNVTTFVSESEKYVEATLPETFRPHLHEITIDFFIDEYRAEVNLRRVKVDPDSPFQIISEEKVTATYSLQWKPDKPFRMPTKRFAYAAESLLLRRLNYNNLLGWGRAVRNGQDS